MSNQEKIHAAFTSVEHAICDLDNVKGITQETRVCIVNAMMRLQKIAEDLERLETSVRLDARSERGSP
jgi:hypothetical protein